MDPSPEYSRFMDYLLFRSLKAETTPAEEQKVREWLRASPDNRSYYEELARLLELTKDAYVPSDEDIGSPPSGRELVQAGHAAAGQAPRRDESGARFARRPRWLWWLAGGMGTVAASVLLFLSLNGWPAPSNDLLSLGVDEFVTGSKDVATVQLRDGTIVRLAPQSRLRLTGSADEREVTLDGRAYFVVAKMEGHPFSVKTRGGDAVVLGTRFEAEARGEELRVMVVEGRVALAAAGNRVELNAGEMARAVEGAVSAAVHVPDPEATLEWVGNFLVFQRATIEEVAAEIRRHFGIQVRVVGEQPSRHTVTAWFADPTAEDVLRVTCKVLAAVCSLDDARATIDLTPTKQ